MAKVMPKNTTIRSVENVSGGAIYKVSDSDYNYSRDQLLIEGIDYHAEV